MTRLRRHALPVLVALAIALLVAAAWPDRPLAFFHCWRAGAVMWCLSIR
jgi:hypothetical protein